MSSTNKLVSGIVIGILGCAVASLIKENNEVVDDYNNLLDFVNSHDCYKKEDSELKEKNIIVNKTTTDDEKVTVHEYENGFKLYTVS